MLSILHFISGLPQEGAQAVLYQNLCSLDRKKYRAEVISLMDEGPVGKKIKQLGIPVYAAGMAAGKPTISSLVRLLKILTSCGTPDITQGWDYHGNLVAFLSNVLMRWHASVIWGIHHTPNRLSQERILTSFLINLERRLSHRVSKVLYVSFASKIRHESLGYNSTFSQVIPNGFDLSKFTPSMDFRSSVRAELGLDHNVILIGSFARFHPMKDHASFLDSARLISSKFTNAKFLLVGKDMDIHNHYIMEIVNKEGLASRVILLGERNDIPRLMASLDVFTVSSAWGESFPIVIGEAMSSGVPCVVTDVGDAARIIGQTGIVVPPSKPEALAAAWENLLMFDPEERRKLGNAARQRVAENYSLETMIQAYENLYLEMKKDNGR